ncbi:U4/U6.U5 tri-snRNP-associated protein 1 [Saguinus oedipus]|uniref:U4/U6.U5 tri-snRNP-associated protein 1 n=1 Tax=Saguinus oedipus TaxID=9490 RepID=A0ABQ9UTM3_SAGOE|nr:U4/U6.U5 tri-snRNP-associated protein 1 [Saguinus oedipus]
MRNGTTGSENPPDPRPRECAPSHEPLGQAPGRAAEAAALSFPQHDSGCRATRKCSHFALSGLGSGRARGGRATMGSSKKHRGEKEAAGTTAAAGTGGATEQPPRHREHKKHKHRSSGSGGSGGERRKRSRERGGERGSGRRGAEAEARSSTHGRERSQAEPSERRVKREKRDDGYEAGEEAGPAQGRRGQGSRSGRVWVCAQCLRRSPGRETPGRLPASSKTSSGDASSLSIEETNKLRAKLGLKPLEVNAVKKEAGTKEEPVTADVINPMALRQREELREKLAAAKEKRLLNQKLGKIKTLGEDDPWLDDTAAWIERSRQLQKEKDLAEKRAKLLEEMDQEFGVSTLVEEEFGQRRQDLYSARDLQGLTVEHAIDSFREGETMILTLKDKGVLQEEEDVLVNVNLVDKERAEKNVELRKKKPDYLPYVEDESVDDLAQARGGQAGQWGMGRRMSGQKPHSILSKYDEELEGERPHSFRLEQGGTADGLRERELEEIRAKLRLQAQSLSTVGPRLASEYLTPEEMVTFKKTKRRVKKIRKKEKEVVVRADDLLPLGDQTQDGDFGSRLRGRGRRRVSEVEEEKESVPQPPPSDDTRVENMDISDEEENGAPPPPGSPQVLEEDEAELELQKQLEKGRRLRQLQQLRDSGEKVVEIVKKLECRQRGWEEDEDPERKGAIVFNATSEFCRTLGEIPTYGLAGNREEQEELMDFERDEERSANGGSESDGEENIGWSTVNLDEEKQQQDVRATLSPRFSASSTTILDEEPIVNRGLAAALLLCQNKGRELRAAVAWVDLGAWAGKGFVGASVQQEREVPPTGPAPPSQEAPERRLSQGWAAWSLTTPPSLGLLETTVQKVARVKAPNKSLPSAVYCIEDKISGLQEHGRQLLLTLRPPLSWARAIDDKYSRREEYRGFTQDFKEKDGYKPDVKIEYVDETGRKLTPKEAFRQLSHRFHGKGSGKMKTERRMKKLDEEALLKKMSSSDTPLGTVALLQEKQKAQKTPYIVLSGSGKSMNA